MHFGTPRAIVSDNGRHFIRKEFFQLLENYKVEHRRTPPYTPQCDPPSGAHKQGTENYDKSVPGKSQKRWDLLLPELTIAYNTAISESTGYTPVYLNFGPELIPPESLHQENGERPDTRRKIGSDASRRPWNSPERKLRKVPETTEVQNSRRDWAPTKGDEVLKKHHRLKNKAANFDAKMAPKYEGPFLIHRKRAPVIFDLKAPDGKILKHIHVRDLKPYRKEKGEGEQDGAVEGQPEDINCVSTQPLVSGCQDATDSKALQSPHDVKTTRRYRFRHCPRTNLRSHNEHGPPHHHGVPRSRRTTRTTHAHICVAGNPGGRSSPEGNRGKT